MRPDASELTPELVCQQCLRNFSKFAILGQAENIRLSRPALLRHQKTCSLRYSDPISKQEDPIVYCIAPDAPMDERRRAFHTAQTMSDSDQVPGDLIGWYPKPRESKVYAFLPVSKGQVMGFVIVRKRVTIANIRSTEGWAADEEIPRQRWCIDKIWIYQPRRLKGIASSTLRAIAQYLGESPQKLGWLCPLNDEGAALAHAFSGDSLYFAG